MIQRIPCALSELILDLQDPLFTGSQHDIEIPSAVRTGPCEMELDGILLIVRIDQGHAGAPVARLGNMGHDLLFAEPTGSAKRVSTPDESELY